MNKNGSLHFLMIIKTEDFSEREGGEVERVVWELLLLWKEIFGEKGGELLVGWMRLCPIRPIERFLFLGGVKHIIIRKAFAYNRTTNGKKQLKKEASQDGDVFVWLGRPGIADYP